MSPRCRRRRRRLRRVDRVCVCVRFCMKMEIFYFHAFYFTVFDIAFGILVSS